MPRDPGKTNVCFIFSGETREYNRAELFKGHKWLADQLKSRHNYHVDFIGHTWDHCDTPLNFRMFKHYKKENQEIIDEWVLTNPFVRGWWAQQHHVFQKFVKDNWGKDHAIFNKIIQNSRSAYGQIFSFFNCIEQVKDTEKYDVYFKTRWDISIKKLEGLIDYFPYVASRKDERFNMFDGKGWCTFGYDNSDPNTKVETFINDTNFLMSMNAFKEYQNLDYQKQLHTILENTRNKDAKPSSHTLWTLMHPKGITGRFAIAGDCYSIYRTPGQQEEKEEKNRWAI